MTDRVKAHRQRMKAAGWKQSAIWLPPEATEKLERLCKETDLTRQDVIVRLILEAGTETKAPRKKTVPAKKKAATKKKARRTRRKVPDVHSDALGLERPPNYEDWEAAVSIEIEKERLNRVGEHADWLPVGMIRHSYIWDGEAELATFKKKHAQATIETSYPRNHKRTLEWRACYGDGEPDYRLTIAALPARKKK